MSSLPETSIKTKLRSSADPDLVKGGLFLARRRARSTTVDTRDSGRRPSPSVRTSIGRKKSPSLRAARASPYSSQRSRSPFVDVVREKKPSIMPVKRSPLKKFPTEPSLLQPITAADPDDNTESEMEDALDGAGAAGGIFPTPLLVPRGDFQSPLISEPPGNPPGGGNPGGGIPVRNETEQSVREREERQKEAERERQREKQRAADEEKNRMFIAQENEKKAKQKEAERKKAAETEGRRKEKEAREAREREERERKQKDRDMREQGDRESRKLEQEKQDRELADKLERRELSEQQKRERESSKSVPLVSLSPFVTVIPGGGARPKTSVPPQSLASTPQSSRPPSSSFGYFRPIAKTPVTDQDQQITREWLGRYELGDSQTPIRRPRSIPRTPAADTPFGRTANQSMLNFEETPMTRNPYINLQDREEFNFLVRQKMNQLALEEEVEQRAREMLAEAKELKRLQKEEEDRKKLEEDLRNLRLLEEQAEWDGREADTTRVQNSIQRRRMVEQRRQKRRAGEDVDSSTEEESLTGPFRTITATLGKLSSEVQNPARRREIENNLAGLNDRTIRTAFKKSLAPEEISTVKGLTTVFSEALGAHQRQINDRLDNDLLYRIERIELNERLATRAAVEKKDDIRANLIYSAADADSETFRRAINQMQMRLKVIEKATSANQDAFFYAHAIALESNIIAMSHNLSKNQQRDLIFNFLPNTLPVYNILKLNNTLEALLATISTLSTSILTRTALESKLKDWKLVLTNEKDMQDSICNLFDMLNKNRDDFQSVEPQIADLYRMAITKIIHMDGIPASISEQLYQARLKIRDEDSFNECLQIVKAVLMKWLHMRAANKAKFPKVKLLTMSDTKLSFPKAQVDGFPKQKGKAKAPKVVFPPRGSQSTQVATSTFPPPPRYQNTGPKKGKPQMQTDGFKVRRFVNPWPKDKVYLNQSGNKLTKEFEAYFSGHCHKCGHSSHNADQCLTYPNKTTVLTLCELCRQGMHDICKSKRPGILAKSQMQVKKLKAMQANTQDGLRQGQAASQQSWSPYLSAPASSTWSPYGTPLNKKSAATQVQAAQSSDSE